MTLSLKDNFNDLFGMKPNFNFFSEEAPTIHNISQEKSPPPINNVAPISPDDENPIIKAIISELGGKEIRKTDG